MEQSDEIFKISTDKLRAKDLLDMAIERLEIVIKAIPKTVPYKILEEYYEVAVQLITSIMYSNGLKTLNHIKLIEYLSKTNQFNQNQINILDQMRRFRHGTVYYGRKESGNFFINNEEEIKEIINKLLKNSKDNLR